jgi:hypothetical protein
MSEDSAFEKLQIIVREKKCKKLQNMRKHRNLKKICGKSFCKTAKSVKGIGKTSWRTITLCCW